MDRALSALQDLTRRDILLRFYSDPAPKTALDVARFARIHRSVAFDHLERLVGLGYLEVELRRGFPGKPAKLYRLAQGPISFTHPPRQFALLAQQLASALEDFGPAGLAAAHAAGKRFAASLEPGQRERTLRASLQPIEALGARYEIDAGAITMTNCLFHEACQRSAAVRRFQAGMLEGLIEAARPGVRVQESPDAGGLCTFAVSDAAEQAAGSAASA